MQTATMNSHSEAHPYMTSERRSHSYDESFLYYGNDEEQYQQRQGGPTQTVSRKPPLHYQTTSPREGPPLVSRDDIALGTTVVSPLGRYRAMQYQQQEIQRQQQQSRSRIPTVSPMDTTDADSVPFDQQQDDRFHKSHVYRQNVLPPDRSVRPFDEESTHYGSPPGSPPHLSFSSKPVIQSRVHGPHRTSLSTEQALDRALKHHEQAVAARFRMPAVRVSKPALDAGIEDEQHDNNEQHNYDPEPPALYRITQHTQDATEDEAYLSPANSGKVSMQAHASESPMQQRLRGIDDAYEEFGNGSINTKGNTTEEDDSIFDFAGDKHKQKQQQLTLLQQNRRSKRSSPRQVKEGDETSEDGMNEPCTSLTVRTQEAWKRKSTREQQRKTKAESHVSFAANNPPVHRYNESAAENSTLAGASLNSEYTKSVESEVEDAIKDIFLIGSGTGNYPGRRKLKYRPDMRRRLRWEQTHPPDDDTPQSEDDTNRNVALENVSKVPKTKFAKASSTSRKNNKESQAIIRSIEEKKTGEADALLGAWNMVESSLQAMGAAFGIDTPDDETAMTYDDSRDSTTLDTLTLADDKSSPPRQNHRKSSRTMASVEESYDSSTAQSRTSSAPPGSNDLLDYWAGGFLGGTSSNGPLRSTSHPNPSKKAPDYTKRSTETLVPSSKKAAAVTATNYNNKPAKAENGAPSLDKDLRLIELAVQSARSYHTLRGVVYDESDVDIVTDIKFIVVDLTLPLGLIFQENEAGCWVTKVLTEGSAIKKSIQVGDQLAAIDGKSSIGLTVDDIAMTIRQKKSRPFELTFLRYVGPLRPVAGTVEEEGYEIKARLAAAEAEHKAKGRKQRLQSQQRNQLFSNNQNGDESPTGREKRRFRFFGRKK